VEQAVDQAGRERVAGAETIDNLHLIGARPQDTALLVSDGRPGVLPHQRVLTQRDGDNLQWEAVGHAGGGLLVILAGDAQDALDVLLGGDEHVAELHQVGHAAAGLGLAPQFDAVIQIHAGLQADGAGSLQRFARRLGGTGTQRRRDAGDVEPFNAGEHFRPRYHAGPDRGDGRGLAIVQYTAGARGGAEFEEVNANAILRRPDDVLAGHAGLASLIGDEPT